MPLIGLRVCGIFNLEYQGISKETNGRMVDLSSVNQLDPVENDISDICYKRNLSGRKLGYIRVEDKNDSCKSHLKFGSEIKTQSRPECNSIFRSKNDEYLADREDRNSNRNRLIFD